MSLWAAGSRQTLAVWCIVLANLLGGVSYPAQKAALAGLPPATVTLLRNAVAVLALFVCVRVRGAPATRWSKAELGRVIALGSVAFALPMWLGIVGMQRASASNASILILLEPVTIVALAALVLGERVGPLKLVILVLGLSGALCIVLEGAALGDLLAGEHFLGNALLALHGVLWGCYTPLAKPLSVRHDPFDLCLRAGRPDRTSLRPSHGAWRSVCASRSVQRCCGSQPCATSPLPTWRASSSCSRWRASWSGSSCSTSACRRAP
jgi:drug/metabolite transporter (DMT)-like permease